MKIDINDKFSITKDSKDNSITTNLIDESQQITYKETDTPYLILNNIYNTLNKKQLSVFTRDKMLKKIYQGLSLTEDEITARLIKAEFYSDSNEAMALANFENGIQLLMNFFTEFQVDLSIRFVDTLLRQADKKTYIKNYFLLCDHPAHREIIAKLDSAEFDNILSMLKYKPAKPVNNHLKVYFGPAGTGKTTKACSESTICIVCSSDMTCKDLLQDFKFVDGKATFEKSALWLAIEEGKTITLDEINLLNRDTIQFLQGLTDGKESINFLGNVIKIHPNFKVIGTMNLIVNGMTFPLSEPLVDRCSDIVEYKLKARDIFNALVSK